MKNASKRLFCLMLVLAMVVGVLPVMAAAEEPVKVTIASGTPVGGWIMNRVGSASVPPENTFDSSMTTMWNPQAGSASYAAGEGIVYALDNEYDVTKISLTFMRKHYFQVLVSNDGVNYDELATVTAANEAKYLTVVDDSVADKPVISYNFPFAVSRVNYVKVLFTGNIKKSDFVAMYDITVMGTPSAEVSAEVPVIVRGELVGSWLEPQTGTSVSVFASYDNSATSMWNPGAQGNFVDDPGVIYTLKNAVHIEKMQFDFGNKTDGTRIYYLDVFVSTNGTDYIPVAEISAANETMAYPSGTGLCVLDGLSLDNVKYVKVIFRERKSGADYVALQNVSFSNEGTDGLDTSWMLPYDGNVKIESASLTGTWAAGGETTLGRTYDDNMATFWNPGANSGYAGQPGIVYTLNNNYDLTKLELSFTVRYAYFDVSVSVDGVTYIPVAAVNANNTAKYYKNGYICTIDGLTAENIKYIKITFTGDSDSRCWLALNEVNIEGEISSNTNTVYAAIAGAEPVGTWVDDRVGKSASPTDTYDSSLTTLWNPNAASIYFRDGEGIVYTLDKLYDISEISVTFMRNHYFTLQVSGNGTSYKTLAIVNADNAATAYTVVDDSVAGKPIVRYDLEEEFTGIKYVKVLFAGHINNNSFISLYDMHIKGVASEVQEPVCDEHSYGDWNIEKAATYTEAGSRSKSCIYCGNTVTEEIPVLANPVTGYNIVLCDNISVNFQMNLKETDVITVTVNGNEASYERNENGISVSVAAAQMTDIIVISVNGIALPNTYSVRGYADYILDEANGFDDATKNLVKAMLCYGGAAQEYFDYNADPLASAGIEMDAAVPTGNTTVSVSDNLAGISFYGATLVHEDKTAVRFYFSGSIDGLTADQGNFVQKGDMYYIEVAGINPQNIGDTIEVEVTDGTDSLTVSYSPLTYIVRMYEKADSSAATKALVKALYNYYLAALAYTN